MGVELVCKRLPGGEGLKGIYLPPPGFKPKWNSGFGELEMIPCERRNTREFLKHVCMGYIMKEDVFKRLFDSNEQLESGEREFKGRKNLL